MKGAWTSKVENPCSFVYSLESRRIYRSSENHAGREEKETYCATNANVFFRLSFFHFISVVAVGSPGTPRCCSSFIAVFITGKERGEKTYMNRKIFIFRSWSAKLALGGAESTLLYVL